MTFYQRLASMYVLALQGLALLFIGGLGVLLYQADDKIAGLQAKVTSLETSNRTAWGKVYDLQESRDDEAFHGEAALHLKVFEAEKALQECREQRR